jgi:hypothetical protein
MKRILSLLFLAGALTVVPGLATAKQSSTDAVQPQATGNPQAQASSQASSHSRHHSRRSSTTRHHRRHKATAKH